MHTHPIINVVAKYGFTSHEDVAIERLDKVVHNIVGNTLENLSSVLYACNCKVADSRHFELMVNLNLKKQNTQKPQKKQKKQQQSGGGTVLPSEYFGDDSGRYFADVSANEVIMSSDLPDGLARPALEMSGGSDSSSHSIPAAYIVSHIRHHKPAFRMTNKAKMALTAVVATNLDAILKNARGKAKSQSLLSAKLLDRVLSLKKFRHL